MPTNRQSTAQIPLMADRVELDIAFEDAGGLSSAEYQKPAPSSLTPKTVEASQSLAVVVDTLVDVVGQNESQLFASLNPNDYQQLVGVLEALTAVVGENKNHLLTPLMNSIDTFIEKCKVDIEEDNEEKIDMKIQNHSLGQGVPKLHRSEKVGRPVTRPRVKLSDLLAQDAKMTGSNGAVTERPFKLHRPEKVGRPATRPRVKLADLLAQETDDTASGEVKTGPPVGNEVW